MRKLAHVPLAIVIATSINITTPIVFSKNYNATFAESNITVGQTQDFVVSAYYSPLPNQDEYVWGSYEADKRMNGEGVRGADFTKVYPGMIAAPKSYAFGTKINIPGFGTGAVHDRGGRITEWNDSHRIDLWMGYGDDGRKRALQWGMKTVTGTIMPEDTPENVHMTFMSKASQEKSASTTESVNSTNEDNTKKTLYIGDRGESVKNLQEFLIRQNVLHVSATGYYGEQTKDAVFQFQKKHNIVASKTQTGAGVFGPTTRKTAESVWTEVVSSPIVASTETNSTTKATHIDIRVISDSSEAYNPNYAIIKPNLQLGDKGDAVMRLQLVLKGMKYYSENPTGLYDEKTVEAVYAYQIDNNIVSSKTQLGAGRFGPATYGNMVNTLLHKRNTINTKPNTLAFDSDFITEAQIAMRKQKIEVAKFNVQTGERSEKVKELQEELIARGFLENNLNTGFYGKKTHEAITAYKAYNINNQNIG